MTICDTHWESERKKVHVKFFYVINSYMKMVHILRLFCVAPKKCGKRKNERNTQHITKSHWHFIWHKKNAKSSPNFLHNSLIQCEMLVYSCLYVYVCVCSCIQFSARFQFTKIDNTIKKENRLNLSQTRNARCIYGNVNIFVRNSTQKVDFSINKEKEKLIFCCRCLRFQRAKKFSFSSFCCHCHI